MNSSIRHEAPLMKTPLALAALLVALAAVAHAQDGNTTKPQKKPVPDLNKSPWSATITNQFDGYTGDQRTVIKRDIGDGWAIGGQMVAPYEDPKIGGSAPDLRSDVQKRSTIFGPYLEKKF